MAQKWVDSWELSWVAQKDTQTGLRKAAESVPSSAEYWAVQRANCWAERMAA